MRTDRLVSSVTQRTYGRQLNYWWHSLWFLEVTKSSLLTTFWELNKGNHVPESLCGLYELFTRPLRVFGCDYGLTTIKRLLHLRVDGSQWIAEPDFGPERMRTWKLQKLLRVMQQRRQPYFWCLFWVSQSFRLRRVTRKTTRRPRSNQRRRR